MVVFVLGWPPGIQMVVINRNLAFVSREGHRQFPGRIVVAEQYVGNGISGFRTQPPSVNNGGHVVCRPVKNQRPAGIDQDNDRLSGFLQFLDEFFLYAGQVNRATAFCLSAHVVLFPDAQDDDIGLIGHGNGFGKTSFTGVIESAAARVQQLRILPDFPLQAFPLRDDVCGIDVFHVNGPETVVCPFRLDHWPDEGDGFGAFRQRQNTLFVLKQDDTFGRNLTRSLRIFGIIQFFLLALFVAETVWIVKKPKLEFLVEYSSYGVVHNGFRHFTFRDQLR